MKTYSRKKPALKIDFEDISLNFNEICRLCLSVEGEKYQIFRNIDEVPLPLRIMACLSVEVFEGDGLPTQICHQCIEELDSHYRFKQRSESSDARLRQYLKHTRTGQLQHSQDADVCDSEPSAHTLLPQSHCNEQQILENISDELQNHGQVNINLRSLLSSPTVSSINETNTCNENAKQNENPANSVQPQVQMQSKVDQQTASMSNVKEEYGSADHSITITVVQPQPQNQEQEAEGAEPSTGHYLADQGLPFMCSQCPKRFAKRIDLRRHESVHNQQRGFECPLCEKWFPNKTSYGRHERTHTGERPYTCSQCGKSFSQGAILARHIMTHTGVKPFKCEVCGKGFTQREGLRVHMRQHTKEQPEIQLHECPLCEKSFCHPSGLSRHLIIHTGKTFDCRFCPKVFTDSSSLRRHMKRHSNAGEQSLTLPS